MGEKLVFQNACALGWETNNHSYTCFSGRTKKMFQVDNQVSSLFYFVLFLLLHISDYFTHKLIPYHAQGFKHPNKNSNMHVLLVCKE